MTVDPAVAKRFCAGHLAVTLRCSVAVGGAATATDAVVLQLTGSNPAKPVDPKSKQALSAFFPVSTGAVDTENGMDLSRQIRMLQKQQVPSDAALPQLVVASNGGGKPMPSSLNALVVGYFATGDGRFGIVCFACAVRLCCALATGSLDASLPGCALLASRAS